MPLASANSATVVSPRETGGEGPANYKTRVLSLQQSTKRTGLKAEYSARGGRRLQTEHLNSVTGIKLLESAILTVTDDYGVFLGIT